MFKPILRQSHTLRLNSLTNGTPPRNVAYTVTEYIHQNCPKSHDRICKYYTLLWHSPAKYFGSIFFRGNPYPSERILTGLKARNSAKEIDAKERQVLA